ncbi:hypothetical protein EZV73_23970 [Acidaminobacter sp. JC074]|uniref:hypothetical protein n=1 Tax=Acidaminobacter sp. JC074 TaxID=2530199 RepID=UPI001F0D4870|nr:hypothetical protein [Acidaminobacter sp. JC074]MCH4890661.1 hypothetical protein [Acidaminobacter sp. JC074]
MKNNWFSIILGLLVISGGLVIFTWLDSPESRSLEAHIKQSSSSYANRVRMYGGINGIGALDLTMVAKELGGEYEDILLFVFDKETKEETLNHISGDKIQKINAMKSVIKDSGNLLSYEVDFDNKKKIELKVGQELAIKINKSHKLIDETTLLFSSSSDKDVFKMNEDDFLTGYIVIKGVAKGKAKLNTLIINVGGSKVEEVEILVK